MTIASRKGNHALNLKKIFGEAQLHDFPYLRLHNLNKLKLCLKNVQLWKYSTY